jgi:hypothetical protein
MRLPDGAQANICAIHDKHRREFRALPGLVADGTDDARVDTIADHVTFVMQLPHANHDSGNDLVWPKVLDRAAAGALRGLLPTLEEEFTPLSQCGRAEYVTRLHAEAQGEPR